MNNKLKYSSIFLLFTISILLASSLVAAVDIEDSQDLSDDIITNTACDDVASISQTDNNIESQKILEVDNSNDDTQSTSNEKELVKEDKNLKTALPSGTMTATPNSAKPGETVTLSITSSKATSFRIKGTYDYKITLDGNSFLSDTIDKPGDAYTGSFSIIIPEYAAGTYNMEVNVHNSRSTSFGVIASTTFTILEGQIHTKITEVSNITGELGNTILPITVTDLDGNSIEGTSTITIKDQDNVLVDNYQIVNGVANISVPTTRTGIYDLTVEFAANDNYVNSSSIIPVIVNKSPVTLTVDQDDDGIYTVINPIHNTVLTGNLRLTSNGAAIKNGQLSVKVDGIEYIITTDDEGKFSFDYNVTKIADTIPISIQYTGNDLYLASEEYSGVFDIETMRILIFLDDVNLSEVNETTTITGYLLDMDSEPARNIEIDLEAPENDDKITVISDNEGKFSYDFIFTYPQDVTVTASVHNAEIFESDPIETGFTAVIGPRRTNLSIDTGAGVGTNIDITGINPYKNEVITHGRLMDIFNEPVANAEITITINNKTGYELTDNEGNFWLIFNATESLTTYNISVSFDGNDAYKAAGEVYTGTFKTEAFDITVTIDDNFPDEILVGDSVTISGSATLQNNTLANNQIVIKVDGRTFRTNTDDEGKYSYNYIVLNHGQLPVTATATFNNADIKTATATMNVAYPKVIVDLNPINDTTVFSDVIISGRVYIVENNTGLDNDLYFTINNKRINLASDEDGYFTYTFTPDSPDVYTIDVKYTRPAVYDIQNASATINVAKRQAILVNDKLPIAVTVNDNFTISGTLIDETNTTISNAKIIFKINNITATATTDSNGRYSYSYKTQKVSDNNLYEVRYSGDNKYDLARNYAGSFFDVEKQKALINVNAYNTSINEETTVSGSVYDRNNNSLSNVNVKLLIKNDEYTATTNSEGIYEITYTPTKAGKYTIKADIDDENYRSYTNSCEFNVKKIETTTTISPVRVNSNLETNITATITDSNNNPVTLGKAVFKTNGKTIKDANGKVIYVKIANGTAVLNHVFTQEDIDNNVMISAAFTGTSSYDTSLSQKVRIITADEHNITMTLNDITATPGDVIKPVAIVKDFDENANVGKVIFKINGKTVKDANNKVIYTQVVDGIASCEYTIPESMKVRSYTLSAVFIETSYNRSQANSVLNIISNENSTQIGNDSSISNNISSINTTNNLKTAKKVIIINNDNIDEYITADGLSDLVNEGDTLDIQGLIDKEHSLVINKKVTVISSTQNAIINLHTVAGSLFGEDPGNCFVVNKAGAGSFISGLHLNNTECWIFNTHDVTLYNMTMYVKDARVGSGVGQTAIRYSERITIDSCFIYTENNGGSTSMAFTGVSHALIKNTTIQGVYGSGQVGNILYLGNRYNTGDKPDDYTLGIDNNITIVNSTLKGECLGAITVLVYYGQVANVTYINNTFNTTGDYGRVLTRNGDAIGNKFYQTSYLEVSAGTTARDNILYGDCKLIPSEGATVYNNIIGTLDYSADANLYNNTINNVIMYSGRTLSNQVITGNVYLSSKKITGSPKLEKIVLQNNTIYGNIEITGASTVMTKRVLNSNITGNNIGGNIILTNTQKITIENNTINGTISVPSSAAYTVINNNIIVTSNEYAITNQIGNTNITNNYLISDNYHKVGDEAVQTTVDININNNGPEVSEFLKVEFDPIEATIGESTVIIVNVVDEISGNTIEEGEVYLMINDKVLTDENGEMIKSNVVGSQAIFDINEVPTEWLRSDALITAVYNYGEITKVVNSTMNIAKQDAIVEITTDNLSVSSGSSITLTARVTDNNGNLLDGQLAFKLDNNSLEDSEANLICVDVVDGIATLEYTLPSDVTSGTYSLSAVFKNTYFNRSVDNKTLIIE